MITPAADEISNSGPTRITMPFLGLLQAGLVLLLGNPLTALLRKVGLRSVTVLVNQRIMTWFLWHLTVMVGLAHLPLALDAWAPMPEPLRGSWWATRPLWALVLLALTGGGSAGDGPVRGAVGRQQAGARCVEADPPCRHGDRRARGDGLGGRGGERAA